MLTKQPCVAQASDWCGWAQQATKGEAEYCMAEAVEYLSEQCPVCASQHSIGSSNNKTKYTTPDAHLPLGEANYSGACEKCRKDSAANMIMA